jgi:hypothetical protein
MAVHLQSFRFAGFNDAAGGTETTVTNYNSTGQTWKAHSLTNGQTLTVLAGPKPFSVLVAGEAGAGGLVSSGRGGGGGAQTNASGGQAGIVVVAYQIA